MTQTPGWYDDPQDPSQLRYWDGVIWSSHVTPKVSPNLEQSNIGMPYGVTPAAARPHAPGSQGAQGAPVASGGDQPPRQGQSGLQGQGQQGGQWPTHGRPQGQLGQQRLGWASNAPTTPDGAVLAGWWKRVLARIIDYVIVLVLALPVTFASLGRAVSLVEDYEKSERDAGRQISFNPEIPGLNELMLPVVLTVLAVYLVYEIAFLSRTGATPGKMAAGISVRLRDRSGPPPLKAILGRSVCYFGFQLLPFLPVLDVLWPLGDNKRQAIHDKVGATNVVVGRQPRRRA
jgi:uncharacterized RDD family membrane protein YckC